MNFLSFRYIIYKIGKKLIPISQVFVRANRGNPLTMLRAVFPYEKISVSVAVIIFVTVLLPVLSFIEQLA